MIGSVGSGDYSTYVPLLRGGGPSPACGCGQPGCGCAMTAEKPVVAHGAGEEGAVSGARLVDKAAAGAASSAASRSSEAELAMVRELQQRDRQVRQHEMAHIAASGGLAQGGPTYTYQRGPDGQNYAIGGHVNIDISPGQTPEETVQKAQTIRAAALAPADPSGQDRAVAAKASQMEMQARLELAEQQVAERDRLSKSDDADSPAERLAQRILAALTPPSAPAIQVMA